MNTVIVLLGMLACLFGPTTFFLMVGYKALEKVGRRPSDSARVLTVLIIKIVITAAIAIGLQMILLKVFENKIL